MGHENRLTDNDEQLLRQLSPQWKHGDRITSQLFKPTKKDEGLLSTDRASRVSAQDSFDAHIALGFRSDGVYGVTVGEVSDGAGVTAHDDPRPPEKPHHAFIAMDGLTRGEVDAAAGLLRDCAVARGLLHTPA